MSGAIPAELSSSLEVFAGQKKVLIALDFDGTLAPLVDDPEASRMIAPAREALERLTALSGVTIALVTGRAIDSLKRVADPLDEWFLVGSHGIEVLGPGEFKEYQTPWMVPNTLREEFEAVVSAHPGTRLEHKPFGLALHTRGVDAPVALAAEVAVHRLCENWPVDLVVRTGHGIVECSIKEATKADGIEEVRRKTSPTSILFAGDDRTDEDGFTVLGPRDVSIHVGLGDTRANFCVAGVSEIASCLKLVCEVRSQVTI